MVEEPPSSRSPLPGASICSVPLSKSFPVKNYFWNSLSRENTLFHDSDKFPCTLSAIVNDSSEHKKVYVNELTGLRSNWLIGYYALGRDKFSAKTISINKFSSERVDSKGLYGR